MMKRVLTGSSSRKSSLPVRMCSESWMQLVRKKAVKICWMKWLAPISMTTCHLVQSPMWSVCVDHGDEAELQREPEQLDDDPQQEVGFETHLAHDGVLPERGVDARSSGWSVHR